MNLFSLYLVMAEIGLFSIGGAYVAIPLIEQKLVSELQLIDMATFTDMITIAEMTPGPIAINTATFVGMHVASFWGAVAATLGSVTPAAVICLMLANIYKKYRHQPAMQRVLKTLRPIIISMIAVAALKVLSITLLKVPAFGVHGVNIKPLSLVLFLLCLGALQIKRLSPLVIMAGAGLVNLLLKSIF